MEINQSEISQHEFEKMLWNLRNQGRGINSDSFSLRVHRIVEAFKDKFFHDSLELLEKPIAEILAGYGVAEYLTEEENKMLLAELFVIAESKEFAEITQLVQEQEENADNKIEYSTVGKASGEI